MGESPMRSLSRLGAHRNVLDASLFLLQKKVGRHHLDKRLYKTFPDTYAIGCTGGDFMANQKNNNQQNKNNIAEDVKNTAGAAFHAVHKGLETTEDVAMNAVDATSNAVNNVTNGSQNNKK